MQASRRHTLQRLGVGLAAWRAAGLAAMSTTAALAPAAARSQTASGFAEVRIADAPPPSGWRIGADFEPLSAVWLSYDDGHAGLTAGLVAALQDHVGLRFLVPDDATRDKAVRALGEREIVTGGIEFVVEPLASFFLRDMAVFARADGAGAAALATAGRAGMPSGAGAGALAGVVDLRWTQYGMAHWCRSRWGATAIAADCAAAADLTREELDRAIARHLGVPAHRSALALEGGGLETNGEGLVIANEALLRSRNPGLDRDAIEALLLRLPGVRKVVWLAAGLAEDPHLRAGIVGNRVAWGTGGHTDAFVRFADARTVLLAWPDDADVATHPVARLTRLRMQRNLAVLAAATTVVGQPLRVLKVPHPRPIERRVFLSEHIDPARSAQWSPAFFPPRERRRAGQPVLQMATASYLNFVVANDLIVLPDYRRHGTTPARQDRVRRVFEVAFPRRRIAFADAISANWVGGGLHCATLSQP